MKKNIVGMILIFLAYVCTSPAFEANYDEGRVSFVGSVLDQSCKVSINGQGSDANIYISPVSLYDIYSSAVGAYLKVQAFSIVLSDCQAINTLAKAGNAESFNVDVYWSGGNLALKPNLDSLGLLENTLSDGAKNIMFALAINDDNTIDWRNKIIPSDPNQLRVKPVLTKNNIAIYNYYVGYVTLSPNVVTSGPMFSYAVYEIEYN